VTHRSRIYINIGDQIFSLTLFEAKELYYIMRDIFDPNFIPRRSSGDSKVISIKEEKGNESAL